MVSNALSTGPVSLKTPVLCKTPPFPPPPLPPPITSIKFWCFADIMYLNPWDTFIFFAKSYVTWNPDSNRWEGGSPINAQGQYIEVAIWQTPAFPNYGVAIHFITPGINREHIWPDELFTEERPYKSELLEHWTDVPFTEIAGGVIQEIPS